MEISDDIKEYIDCCVKRRQKVLDDIGDNAIAILFAATEKCRSNDTFYPYRQNSYFYYLTGFNEPQSILVLDGKTKNCTLFCREKNPAQEIWQGHRYGVSLAKNIFRINKTDDIENFANRIEKLLSGHKKLYLLNQPENQYNQKITKLWKKHQSKLNITKSIASLEKILIPMRLIKDETELKLLRKAAKISAFGHIKAMQMAKHGQFEYQLEGEILAEFMRCGTRNLAYESIVASGRNACILHYTNNHSMLQNGDLIMIDAGAEYACYAGDISRTFPVSGQFSSAQKDVYQIVLETNKKIINQAHKGVAYQYLSKFAIELLTQGLIDLKLLSGSLKKNIEQKKYTRFYMHGIGHYLGLDVHDVGNRGILDNNMTMTVEPGLYIPDDVDIPKELRGVGIRIEDNVIIHNDNPEIYTYDAPKEIEEIENLMQH